MCSTSLCILDVLGLGYFFFFFRNFIGVNIVVYLFFRLRVWAEHSMFIIYCKKKFRGQIFTLCRVISRTLLFINQIISTFKFIYFESFIRSKFEPIELILIKTRL